MTDLEYASVLQKMIQVETVSQLGNVNPDKFRPFHQVLEGLFPTLFALCEKEDFEGSLLLRWKGKSAEYPILLMSHFDVVEAVGNWTHDPFGGEIVDGVLYGRGAIDTKGSLFAILQAAEELAKEGFVPQNDIYFESACTEETSGYGADLIVKELEKRGVTLSMVLDEGGFVVHDPLGMSGCDYAMIGVGEKGAADLKFIARSNGGHASTPGKNTPLVRLGKFMAAVEKSDIFTVELNEVVEEMLKRNAKNMKGALGFIFGHTSLFKPLLKALMPKVSSTANAMMRTTVAFTMARGSNGANVLPQEAWVMGNMRFSVHQGQKASFAAIEELAKKFDIEMEVYDPGIESAISSFRSKQFQSVERAVKQFFPDATPAPYVMNGASDCRYFTRICKNCFRFIPMFVSADQLSRMHGIDENVSVCELGKAVAFYKLIMKENSNESAE